MRNLSSAQIERIIPAVGVGVERRVMLYRPDMMYSRRSVLLLYLSSSYICHSHVIDMRPVREERREEICQ
mgnify:CR=1 FL=1